MRLPEALIFDYGRVLVGPVDEEAFQADLTRLAREYGFERGIDLWNHIFVSQAWEQAKRGRITHEMFWRNRLAALNVVTEQDQAAFKAHLYRHWGLLPGMRQLLDKLRSRYRLAVLSNTSRRDFARYLAERRGLSDTFEVVVSSAEAGVAKPEPEAYQIVLDRLCIDAGQALFIDDLPRNTRAAEALGIPSIVFCGVDALQTELIARGILLPDVAGR